MERHGILALVALVALVALLALLALCCWFYVFLVCLFIYLRYLLSGCSVLPVRLAAHRVLWVRVMYEMEWGGGTDGWMNRWMG